MNETNMVHAQRYVSNELSHFVGRDKTEDEQYDILVNSILKSGLLAPHPHIPARGRNINLDLSKPISTDEIIKDQIVCFCDIPEPDLVIHTKKYSKFGLSFRRKFLIERGASPVFYIANDGIVSENEIFQPDDFLPRIQTARDNGVLNRDLYFDTSVNACITLLVGLDALSYVTAHPVVR